MQDFLGHEHRIRDHDLYALSPEVMVALAVRPDLAREKAPPCLLVRRLLHTDFREFNSETVRKAPVSVKLEP